MTPDEYQLDAQWHCVYRYYNDNAPEQHRLFYIGYAQDWFRRDAGHSRKSWWHQYTTRVDIQTYPTEGDARAAERDAIVAELPVHNSTHTDVARWVPLHREYLGELEDAHWGPLLGTRSDDAALTCALDALLRSA